MQRSFEPLRTAPHSAGLQRVICSRSCDSIGSNCVFMARAGLWSPRLAHTDSGELHRSQVTYDRHAARTATTASLVNVFRGPQPLPATR